jgi:hypothetical protein
MENTMTVMRKINSSNIAAIGYVEQTGTLIVEFKSGATWTYDGVPQSIDDKLRQIEADGGSVGAFFASNIKPIYPGTRMPSHAETESRFQRELVAVGTTMATG